MSGGAAGRRSPRLTLRSPRARRSYGLPCNANTLKENANCWPATATYGPSHYPDDADPRDAGQPIDYLLVQNGGPVILPSWFASPWFPERT